VADKERVRIDAEKLCAGVAKAKARSADPILCLVRQERLQFVAVSGLRLVASWQTSQARTAGGNLAFLIPPLIAELLATDTICRQVAVEFSMVGSAVVCHLTDHLGSYDIRWKSDLARFPAPEAFGQIIQVPEALIEVTYIKFSDAVHQAVAKLAQMEAEDAVNRDKLAILIDLDFGRLRVNGEEIVTAESRQYYFDPRLVIRAIEFLRERNLRVGITPLADERRAYLSLLAEDDGWQVHCSLLSIGLDTQRLYPLPPERDR
jgi:hypothetical protein